MWLRIRQFGAYCWIFSIKPSLPLHHLELNIGTVVGRERLDVKRVAGGWGNLRQSMDGAQSTLLRLWGQWFALGTIQTSPVHKAGKIAVLPKSAAKVKKLAPVGSCSLSRDGAGSSDLPLLTQRLRLTCRTRGIEDVG